MIHIARILSAFALVFVAAACGGDQSSYRLPVDSELKPYQAPEPGAAGGSADDAWDIDFDDEGSDESEVDEAAVDEATEAEAAPEEAAPAASPTPISPADKKTPTKPATPR